MQCGWGKECRPRRTSGSRSGALQGGFGAKIHLQCDADGNQLHFHLSPGQAHDSTMLDTVLEGADAELHDKDGVALAWPLKLAGDKGYRANWIDDYLLDELGITPVIPSKTNEARGVRPVALDKRSYRRRSIVECLIGWLKESRRIATRSEKTAINFGGMVKLPFIHRYFRILGL
ncbi:MAG: IS5 family transposase [Myxococcales bacterium]|nr:IS5 family transposase [Myxococcales bacterium]